MHANTEMIQGRKLAPAHLGDVLILGLGKSGRAVAEYCCGLIGTRIRSLTIAAGDHNEKAIDFAESCRQSGAHVVFDTFTFDTEFDTCIASPGISQFSRFYENAAHVSKEIMSEVEFAWRESSQDSSWIAITGTNGKTTTTTLVHHILQTAGLKASAVGNIGNTCIGQVAQDDTDIYVVEVSSFQLASMIDFAPNAAVLLNITPDHIYWHMTLDAYIEAKKNVYARLNHTGGTLVIDAVNDTTRACVRELKADTNRGFSYIPLGTKDGLHSSMRDACGSDNAAFIDNGVLCVTFNNETVHLVNVDELQIKGEHNASNALAAASAALAMHIDPDVIRKALLSFTPLEHRLEPCGTVHGISCFNDSKATNVDDIEKAKEETKGKIDETVKKPRKIIESERIYGFNRLETAIKVSKKYFEDGASTVILANGSKFSDVLAAMPYSKVLEAPILYTNAAKTPDETLAELRRLGAERVILVGGTKTISSKQEKALNEEYVVDRINGVDRYHTASILAAKIKAKSGSDDVIIASGKTFPDALSVSPLALRDQTPILLVGKEMSQFTEDALKKYSNGTIFIAGGSKAVSPRIANQLREYTNDDLVRFDGADRYETSVMVAQYVRPDAKVSVFASGQVFADALVSAPVIDANEAPILLVKRNDVPSSVSDYLIGSPIEKNILIGGYRTIDKNTEMKIERLENK